MQKEDFHIMIVDDDVTLGKAMAEILSRSGFKTTHVARPDEALNLMKYHEIDAAIIDCMLPKMSGAELAKKIQKESDEPIPIILVSGIYKDRAFQRDALQSTGAIFFQTKPFDLEEFVAGVNEAFKSHIDAPVSLLHQFLSTHDISPKERLRAVEEAETIHSFDLPWVISLLMHNRVSGHLNIISAEGEVSGVGFLNGEIVQVYQDDQKSYFGVLMVEYGFITQEDLEDVMKKAGKTKRLGELLVEANVLSPHAIQIVMAEQQGIRLSKTIKNTSVKINFNSTSEMRVNARTDRSAFTDLLNEWLASKFSLDWLKTSYTQWLGFNIKKGPEWSPNHRVMSIPVVMRVPGIVNTLLESESLEQAMSSNTAPEDHLYRALHALIVTRCLRFGEQNSTADYGAQKNRLNKLLATFESQNHFERLGVSAKAKDSEIKRAYHDLAKVLHPDKLSPEAPSDVRELAKQTFEKVSTAYAVLTDPKAKERYVLELERGRAESILEAEQLAEQARPLLSKGDVKGALALLEKAVSLAPPTSEIRLLCMWGKVKAPGFERDKKAQGDIKEELSQIPPEDRHNATFFFVKALLLRATGEIPAAKRNLEHVLAQAPDFIDARRELSALQQQDQFVKSANILNGDLKDVVGMLFKKRK